MKLEDKTLTGTDSSLKFRQLRQELHASNIANAETPGYKTKKLILKKRLQAPRRLMIN